MQHQKLIPLLFPVLTLIACGTGRSSDVKQSTIEQSYELTYNEAEAQIKATADFHYENTLGTSLKLNGNSKVTFNGLSMNYDSTLNSASYHSETQLLTTPYAAQEFRYVNNDGETFITSALVPAPTVIKLPHEGDHLRGDRELQVVMQGNPIVGTDEVTLCLVYESTLPSDPSMRECLHSEGPMSLVFSREQLARFPVGQELTLEIKREAHPVQGNARIHLNTYFYARPLHITLE